MLTFEEIASYLPHKIDVEFLGSPNKDHYNYGGIYKKYIANPELSDEYDSLMVKKIGKIRSLTIRKNYTIYHVGKRAFYTKSCNGDNLKLICRPLSDLTEPCLKDGKIPIVELAKIHIGYGDGDSNLTVDYEYSRQINVKCEWNHISSNEPFYSDSLFIMTKNINLNKWFVIQKLFEWHFWIGDQTRFGKDIIDINSLK